MGCDIHGVLQSRNGEGWITECEIERGRNYRLFAVLAGVRNGFGFAGIKTHEPVDPISEPRGLPVDFGADEDEHRWDDYTERATWMGDHSHSWLTLAEIKNWPHWDRPLAEIGVVPIGVFGTWDGRSAPEAWCGGVSGPGVVVGTPGATEGASHVEISWSSRTMRDCCRTFLKWLDYVESAHGPDCRIVFGFDS